MDSEQIIQLPFHQQLQTDVLWVLDAQKCVHCCDTATLDWTARDVLIKYVGGDPEQCKTEIAKWGHGGCWADVKPEHFALLGIKKMPHQDRQICC
jgi:hypothetical protein